MHYHLQPPVQRLHHTLLTLACLLSCVAGGTRWIASIAHAAPATAPTAFSCAAVTEMPRDECEALVAFYRSTNGDNWLDNTNWLQSNRPCDFDPVINPDGWFGVSCLFGNVTMLNLTGNRLSGPLPPQLKDLSNLILLKLDENQLSGPLPTELGELTKLRLVFLSNNHFSGRIPVTIGKLEALEILALDVNYLSGPIPSELGKLRVLDSLYLDQNRLSGPIPPELGDLSLLSSLYLSFNELSGPLPVTLDKLAQLETLTVSNNQLTGAIPPELADLPDLEFLALNHNRFSGPIPTNLQQLQHLRLLYLNANQLSGPIPTTLGELTRLNRLYLQNNQLTGAIPAELGNLHNLDTLVLDNNGFTGPIPATLGDLPTLVDLGLAHNQLSGTIPAALGKIATLQYLQLNDNQLSGPIPAELAQLPVLGRLRLQSNGLSGPIPPQLGNLPFLTELLLHNNQLTGSVPSSLGTLQSLLTLRLGHNDLEGTIPATFAQLQALLTLDLAANQLRGEPTALVALPNLITLQLDYNGFTAQDATLRAALDRVAPGWSATQTTPPTNLSATGQSATTVALSWQPVSYVEDGGYYEVSYATIADGPYTVAPERPQKLNGGYTIYGLRPATAYHLRVRTHTPAHHDQQNELWSDYSNLVQATTPVDDDNRSGDADAYEVDDSCAQARSIIADGTPLARSFHHVDDVDWMRINATSGGTYRIEAQLPEGSSADIALELYTECSGTIAAEGQPAFSPGIHLDFTRAVPGAIYLKLYNTAPTGGSSAIYQLAVRTLHQRASGNDALILVAGRPTKATQQPNVDGSATQIYNAFIANRYEPAAITYLATTTGATGVDGPPTAAALKRAITDWATGRVAPGQSLTIYLIAAGRDSTLLLDEDAGEWVSLRDLNEWLTTFETVVPTVQINVVVESNIGTALTSAINGLSKAGRLLIAAATDTPANQLSAQGYHFSDYFVSALRQGYDLLGSFAAAQQALQVLPAGIDSRDGQPLYQEPLLEANGNGIPNELEDARFTAQRTLNFPDAILWPPYVDGATASVQDGAITIEATVEDDQVVGLVQATLYPPSFQAIVAAGNALPTIQLQHSNGNQYRGIYAGPLEVGHYQVVINATDGDNLIARPVATALILLPEHTGLTQQIFLPLIFAR